MSVWQPSKEYWNTDLTKPVTLWFPSDQHWDYNKNSFLEVDAKGNLERSLQRCEVKTDAYKFIFEFVEGNIARIKDPVSGKYITEEDNRPVLKEKADSKAQLWEIRKDYKDKYYIISENTKMKFMRLDDKPIYVVGEWYSQDLVSWLIRN